MAAPTFEIFGGLNRGYYFRLRDDDGEVLLRSEAYISQQSAQKGVESVRAHAQDPERFERRTSSNRSPYFALRATNGAVLGVSETYGTDEAREEGIEAVRRAASGAALRIEA